MGPHKLRTMQKCSFAFCALFLVTTAYARADEPKPQLFDIGPQGLPSALATFARQSHEEILFAPELVATKRTAGVKGTMEPLVALRMLLKDTGLPFSSTPSGAILVGNPSSNAIQSTSASADPPTQDTKEAGKKSSQDFRLAQAPPGQASVPLPLASPGNSTRPSSEPLEEIVVTAQKRKELLKDVPISVSVLTGQDLDKSSAQGVADALNTVPGVSTTTIDQGSTRLTVRGVTASGLLFSGSNPVAYYLDTIPFGLVDSAVAPDVDPYDLDHVEVLRGPQGTLYGANALNGVVRVLTHDADLDQFELKARTSGSSTDTGGDNYRADAAINVPIVQDKLAIRGVVDYQNLSGWIDAPTGHDVNNAELKDGRVKINAQPTEDLSIGASAWFSRDYYGAPSRADNQEQTTHTIREPTEIDFDAYGLKVGYEFPGFSLASMTSYLKYGIDNTLDFSDIIGAELPLIENFDATVFSQEVNLSSTTTGGWRWTAGAIYRDASNSTAQVVPAIVTLDWTDFSRSYAVFGELTRVLPENLELTLGGRYFHDDVIVREDHDVPPIDGPNYYRQEASFSATTPRVVLNWHAAESTTAYGSFSEGYRSGAPQPYYTLSGQLGIQPLKPDKLYNYELGLKTDLLDKRISIDTAVYYMDWKDVQQLLNVPLAGTIVSALINGTSASGVGTDFGLTARPINGLELGVSFSWNNLTFNKDVFSGSTLAYAKGDRLFGSPEYTAGASANYLFPLGGQGFHGQFSASGNYISEQRYSTSEPARFGDNVLIARASFAIQAPKNWEATLYADNINNWHGVVFRNEDDMSPNQETSTRVRPRTIGIQVDYHY